VILFSGKSHSVIGQIELDEGKYTLR
jgi:hypothetical protein